MTKELTIDERIIKFLGLDWKICGFSDHQELFYQIRAVLNQREEDGITLDELLRLYQISLAKREKKHTTLKAFYNWLLEYRVDEEDLDLYKVYSDVAEELGAPTPDPAAFAGRGENLRHRIDEWRQIGKTKNDPRRILYDYCEGVIRMCEKGDDFCRERLHNPSMLFQRFGWGLWEKYVDERWGDKWNYLRYSDEYLKARDKEIYTITQIRSRLFNRIFAMKGWSQRRRMDYQTAVGLMISEKDVYKTLETIKELEKLGECPLEHFFEYNVEEDENNE